MTTDTVLKLYPADVEGRPITRERLRDARVSSTAIPMHLGMKLVFKRGKGWKLT